MYDPPYCAVCGGPFDHVELLDFAGLGDDDKYLTDCAYDSQVLSSDESAVSKCLIETLTISKLYLNPVMCSGSVSSEF